MNKKTKLLALALTSFTAMAAVTAVAVKGNNVFRAAIAQDCAHTDVQHHEAVEPSLVESGVAEYWCCCECHASFSDAALTTRIDNTLGNPTDKTDGRFVDSIGINLPFNAVSPEASVSSEAVPTAAFSTVYTIHHYGANTFKENVSIAKYSKIGFAIKSSSVWYSIDGWGSASFESQVWKLFELEQVSDNVWNIYVSNVGGERQLKVENRSGSSLRELLDVSGDIDDYYFTNVKCVRKTAEVNGTLIDGSAYSANGIGHTRVTGDLPTGYEYVNQIDVGTNGFVHGQFFSGASLKSYSEAHFAMKSSGYILFENWDRLFDGRDQWIYFSLTNNNDDTFNLVIENENGDTVYTRNNIAATGAGPVYTPYALNTMLYGGALEIKPSQRDGYEFTLFVSELRGTKKAVPVVGTVVDSSAMSANGVSLTPSTDVPGGYESAFQVNNFSHGKVYSNVDLRGYSEVHFALRQTGYFLFDGWGNCTDSTEWLDFSLTQNDDTTWNLVVRNLNGDVLCNDTNLGAYKGDDPGAYTNYALNAILVGNPGTGYYPSAKSGTPLEVYVSELRGTEKTVPVVGTVVDTCAYSANGIGITESSEAVPNGYETVHEYNTSGSVHGQFFSAVDIRGYSEVHFALKSTAGFNFNSQKSVENAGWMNFSLTQNSDGTWNIVVTSMDGDAIYSENNLGAYKGDNPGVYTNYALNAILYGIPAGFYPYGDPLTVYATEVRGTSAS